MSGEHRIYADVSTSQHNCTLTTMNTCYSQTSNIRKLIFMKLYYKLICTLDSSKFEDVTYTSTD